MAKKQITPPNNTHTIAGLRGLSEFLSITIFTAHHLVKQYKFPSIEKSRTHWYDPRVIRKAIGMDDDKDYSIVGYKALTLFLGLKSERTVESIVKKYNLPHAKPRKISYFCPEEIKAAFDELKQKGLMR